MGGGALLALQTGSTGERPEESEHGPGVTPRSPASPTSGASVNAGQGFLPGHGPRENEFAAVGQAIAAAAEGGESPWGDGRAPDICIIIFIICIMGLSSMPLDML